MGDQMRDANFSLTKAKYSAGDFSFVFCFFVFFCVLFCVFFFFLDREREIGKGEKEIGKELVFI